jgi:predicted short-subunit dehydrogenase-like oxidoreductase (DUF2520 family)
MAKPKVAIIGPGCVGQTMGKLLRAKGFTISAVAGRSRKSAKHGLNFIGGNGKAALKPASAARGADIILLTTSDKAIKPVCEELAAAKAIKGGAVVIHCSGAHGPELLDAARERKAFVAALHPIQSFPSPDQAVKRMKGVYFTFDGDAEARPVTAKIVKALGGHLVKVSPTNRALYHGALCVLSNYLVSIADLGQQLLSLSGMGEDEAAKAAMPLVEGTIANLKSVGSPQALTGPIARGDGLTIENHMKALDALPGAMKKLYCELGLYTVDVGVRKGTLSPADARKIVRTLTRP